MSYSGMLSNISGGLLLDVENIFDRLGLDGAKEALDESKKELRLTELMGSKDVKQFTDEKGIICFVPGLNRFMSIVGGDKTEAAIEYIKEQNSGNKNYRYYPNPGESLEELLKRL